jgi:endonuclease/exonuclease/phosphatase family metal-dependent hydrolase
MPDPRPSDRVVIATWNVENLFDEVADGGEYSEFDPNHGWTRAEFWSRCSALAKVIRTLAPGGPDILVLEEVEGEHALDVLNSRFLSDLGYRYALIAPPSVPGIKTAFLSRFPLVRTGFHFPLSDDTPLRPVVEAEFDLGGRALVVLGNHWKSRIPTPDMTEGQRRQAAAVLRGCIADLEERPDHPFVVAVGDFNTSLELSRSHPDRAMVSGGVADADDLGLAVFPGRSAAESSARAHALRGAVWDPWETVTSPPGSYWYRGDWDRLDHAFIAVSSLLLGDWRFSAFQVVAYSSIPRAYGPRSRDGVSDHFPAVLTLVRSS